MRDIFRKCLTEGEQAGRRYVLMLPHDTRSGRHGYYPGNATGNSLEFRDFRDYQAGDDLRHIDWGAYGRSDKLIVKLFRDEVDPHVDIVIDCSRSMAVEGAVKAKAALGLAALLWSAASNAKCTCYSWMAANGCLQVENGSEQPSAWNGLNFESKYSLLESFTILPPKLRKRGVRILLSDLLFPGDPLHVLRHLGEDASAVFVIQILADADINPPWQGSLRVGDSETGETTELFFDEHARKRYNTALNDIRQNWFSASATTGALLTSFTAEKIVGNWAVDPLEENGILGVL
ncbi:MAG: DUF58 domain-containing protein [Desulfobacterales bacterium]|nr:DUF58 domain-containing protein [Desulfobacterales bacterium]